jgi:uncharacterized Fe-S cluster protein YjdI
MEKVYKHKDLAVIWKSDLCIHSGKCVKGLPNVFKPNDKPWIDLSEVEKTDLMKTIDTCPSGALSYKAEEEKKNNPQVEVIVIKGGPLLVKGEVNITDSEGKIKIMPKCSLCRCGASSNKPFCDGTHKSITFE